MRTALLSLAIVPMLFLAACTPTGGTTDGSASSASSSSAMSTAQSSVSYTFCGGIAAFPCPNGFSCVDNPDDSCDPQNGGADCGGICVDMSSL